MPYIIIRSYRQPLRIEVRDSGLVVRAPQSMPLSKIDAFVKNSPEWVALTGIKTPANERMGKPTLEELKERAREYIPARVAFYAPFVGVTYGRITIRNQKKRWGSCSSKGNPNFNCALMLAPPEAIDSIVVHELCHRKQMNHSKAFYDEVLKVYPDYWKWDKWLRENGSALIRRVVG